MSLQDQLHEILERCGNCRFQSSPPSGYTDYLCRRHAPSPANIFDGNNAVHDGGVAHWPVVSPTADWCGDFEPDQTERLERLK